ncbi:MAG: hypothetical protein PHO10_00605 [Gemmiger sp.]|nr:hypothetical protein [Gemmiger sp.]
MCARYTSNSSKTTAVAHCQAASMAYLASARAKKAASAAAEQI